jgi:osmotically-inducible protein OsmY
MRKDQDIQNDIVRELGREPGLQGKDIAVAVRGGVVTLSGQTASYAEMVLAERTASRVRGVRGVANNLEVRLPLRPSRDSAPLTRTH